jgi:hypothetical protein
MRNLLLSVVLSIAGVSTTAAAISQTNVPLSLSSKVSTIGIGKITVGMTVSTASSASGEKFTKVNSGGEPHCLYYQIDRLKGLHFMVTQGVISRIDITNPKITSLSGAKVGDSERKIRSLYGNKIKVEPHHYLPKGHYLVFVPQDEQDKNYRMLFETDGKKVINWRVGKKAEVSWVEGCL